MDQSPPGGGHVLHLPPPQLPSQAESNLAKAQRATGGEEEEGLNLPSFLSFSSKV